ncbi:DUF72 domain-containing protein [Marinobacteraceae bacterium S3BR75-40.1]
MAKSDTRYIVGTSGWNYRHWRGSFYPQKLAQRKWLEYYAEHFPAVEMNATFYRLFPDSTYDKWHEQAPEGFEYVLKMPRRISHRKHLDEGLEVLETFLNSAAHLKEKLGPLLLQIGPHTEADPHALDRLLTVAAREHPIAVEFRDAQAWIHNETLAVLGSHDAAIVDADSPKDSFHGHVTASFAYLRMHGVKDWFAHDYTEKELDAVVDHIHQHMTGKVKTVYVFFNNDYEGSAPRNARDLSLKLANGE